MMNPEVIPVSTANQEQPLPLPSYINIGQDTETADDLLWLLANGWAQAYANEQIVACRQSNCGRFDSHNLPSVAIADLEIPLLPKDDSIYTRPLDLLKLDEGAKLDRLLRSTLLEQGIDFNLHLTCSGCHKTGCRFP